MENADLVSAVQRALDQAGIGGRVTVQSARVPGVVKLLGNVVSEEDRLRADETARSVEDVMDVLDEITLGASRLR